MMINRKYPQLENVRIPSSGILPPAILDAFRRAYTYIFDIAASLPDPSTVSQNVTVIQDTHVNRINLYSPSAYSIGSLYIESDRGNVIYADRLVGQGNAWVYNAGTDRGLLANRPADLGSNDTGFLYSATNASDYYWTGSAWVAYDYVKGASTLTVVGDIPKVTAAGVLGNSALQDNGALVTSSEPLDITGTINTTVGYKVGGTAGITSTVFPYTTITPVTFNLQYKDWTGANQTITVVTGLSLATSSINFSGGISV